MPPLRGKWCPGAPGHLVLHLSVDIPDNEDDEAQRDEAEERRYARKATDPASRCRRHRTSDNQRRQDQRYEHHDQHATEIPQEDQNHQAGNLKPRDGEEVFDAERQTTALEAEERQQLFRTILSTAAFESSNGRSPDRLREVLLAQWPSEAELIERSIGLVTNA